MRLLLYREVKALLLANGWREREARWCLARDNPERIPPQPHRMHSQQRWSRAAVEAWLAAQRA